MPFNWFRMTGKKSPVIRINKIYVNETYNGRASKGKE